MKIPAQGRTRCLIGWSALALLPLAIVLAVGGPWWHVNTTLAEKIQANRDQLSRYQGLVATLPALRAELERERANDAFKAFYFDAATPALAGAQLQTEVQEMVRKAGARPISAQILSAAEDQQPPRVRVRVQLQASTEELLEVLYQLEETRPFLFVDQMSIRSMAPRAGPQAARGRLARQRRGISQQVGELTVRLDIFGFVLGPGQ
jgi:general secretion pathway protein M